MRRRVLGWGLIVYGIAGLALIVAGAIAGLDVATRIERLAADADGTLAAAASATEAAAESFTSVDASLSEAQESASTAAALSRDASGTLRSLAVAMQVNLFGAQPLLPLADEFSTSADQASQLADTLDSVGSSLGDTRTDVSRVGAELEILSDQLGALRTSTGGPDEAPPPLRVFIGLLLAWLAVPAVGAIIGGVALVLRLNEARTTVVERVERVG
ncbi:MAG TPA: hypothetical protein VM253_06220 [Candidatus Limnocylindrales bacterium]|nr:hypothetical protein [Candidatus Limnocylindrales bacterium]